MLTMLTQLTEMLTGGRFARFGIRVFVVVDEGARHSISPLLPLLCSTACPILLVLHDDKQVRGNNDLFGQR